MTIQSDLSEREIEILRLLATGASNKEIAQKLVISPNTVKVHLRNIFAKIGAASRTEATLAAMRMGLVEGVSETPPKGGEPAPGVQSGLLTTLPEAAAQAAEAPPSIWSSRWLAAATVALLAVVILLAVILANNASIFQPPAPTPIPSGPQSGAVVRWQSNQALAEPRSAMAAAAFESALYLFGGETAQGTSASALRFNPAANIWEELATKPTAVSQAQAAVLGEMIYVPGGRQAGGQPATVLEAYAPRQNRWLQLASLPAARSEYALAAFEGQLYLFGGWDGQGYTDSVLTYDPEADAWQTRQPMPLVRGRAAAMAMEGRIFLIGGYNGQFALNSVMVYYPSRERAGNPAWEERAPMPEARYGMGAAALANMIYIIGGEDGSVPEEGFQPLQYLVLSNQWARFERAPSATGSQLVLLALDTRLHVIGGQTAAGLSALHQTYQAIYTISLPSVQN